MSSIASSSRHHLRSDSRQPLVSLPLTTFLPSVTSLPLPPPSPVSLPSKRGPSSFDMPSASVSGSGGGSSHLGPSSPGGKARKVSRTEKDGSETVRKARLTKDQSRAQDKGKEPASAQQDVANVDDDTMGVTPRVKSVLQRDDLGTGRSPARRLFPGMGQSQALDDKSISGISGAIATPPKSPHGRKLAPSPPIMDTPSSASASTSRSPFITNIQVEVDVQAAPDLTMEDVSGDVHDCGFVIFDDQVMDMGRTTGAPKVAKPEQRVPSSSRVTRSRSRSLSQNLEHAGVESIIVSAPWSPASSILPELDNQENVPPPSWVQNGNGAGYPYSPSKSKSHSARSTPSKYSSTTDDEIISLYLSAPYTHTPSSTSGSGTRRRERSKLANEVMLLRGEAMGDKMDVDTDIKMDVDVDGEDELTPGRKGRISMHEGRKRLAKEVDMS